MTTRLQVLLEDDDITDIRRVAKRHREPNEVVAIVISV